MQSNKEMLINVTQEAKFKFDKLRFSLFKAVMAVLAPDKMVMKAEWDMVLTGPDGTVKSRRHFFNIMTTSGKTALVAAIAASITSATAMTFKYIGMGTSTVAAAATDTTLGAELVVGTAGYARAVATVTASTNVLSVVGTFAANNPTTTNAITEAGVLDATTAGNLLNHQVFAAINKAAADSLQVTVQITFA
jgi:hypothetical protein